MESFRTYRVYAKVLGYSLPSQPTGISECFIRKMTFGEQKKRNFKPLNIEVARLEPESYHRSYVAFGVAMDTRIFKTNYVIYTDVLNNVGHDIGGLIGVAIRRFDQVMGALSLAASDWFSQTYKRVPLYKGCDYQICRIYELKHGKENPLKYRIVTGGGSQINLPARKANFDKIDQDLVQRIIKTQDDTFKKALKYLLNRERAFHLGFPIEKTILDLMKSIEIIVKSFGGKGKINFRGRLTICAKKIGLTDEEQKHIINLWKARSNGDVAHARSTSRSENLPPQYPVPSDVVAMNAYFRADLSVAVLLKYFRYKEREEDKKRKECKGFLIPLFAP